MFHDPSSGLLVVTAIVGYLVMSGINRPGNARHIVFSIQVSAEWPGKAGRPDVL